MFYILKKIIKSLENWKLDVKREYTYILGVCEDVIKRRKNSVAINVKIAIWTTLQLQNVKNEVENIFAINVSDKELLFRILNFLVYLDSMVFLMICVFHKSIKQK